MYAASRFHACPPGNVILQMTIAQIVHDNEMFFGLSEDQIHANVGASSESSILLIFLG
jgi:hypothetical protein